MHASDVLTPSVPARACLHTLARLLQGQWTCVKCRTGKVPRYDDAVWAKFSSYRMWPARLLFPVEVGPAMAASRMRRPDTVAVQFFGTNELQWVPVAGIFPFEDTGRVFRAASAEKNR